MEDLVRLAARAHKVLRAASDAAMSRHGVRVGQNLVLEVLWEDDGLTPGQLATRLGLTTPTIVNTATRMETADLVVRRRDPSDARLVRLYLTAKAREVRAPIEQERRRLEERVAAALTEEERRCVRSALEKIIDELS
ncbi:MarR family transcriptional regulator [Actinomadura sp. KC216]|uniref:MarR family winged helix-turn-helix transcriptional regulator n=1 Tax=Actinomadura sp. KC216 TaxID=2530370 RepID=UPI001052C44B|nr:MarR family transcriptional regulator [Actinomadura sp. KC216]TDB76451.1 MarR family transcriptional regulator [Actinomadura sp. KC216]